jgi:hypothetical protein
MHRFRATSLLVLPLILALAAPVSAQQQWGTVKGQVVLAGKGKIQQEFVNVDRDQKDCLKKGKIPKDSLLVNPRNRGVKWAVIWLARDNNGQADHTAKIPTHPKLAAVPQKPAVIDQPCCRFEPHIVTMRAGQEFIGKNTSPIVHNIRVNGNRVNPDNSANLILPSGGQQKIGKVAWQPYYLPNPVSCDIHRWMSAWIFVFANPYYAVTDENGNFEIKDAPAGQYRVIGWHEKPGYLLGDKNGKLITIGANKATDLGKIELKDE